jgi:uncharacterized protein
LSRYPFASALVTGASSGIGAAMASQLASAGIPTIVVARRVSRLVTLASAHPGLVEVLLADLSSDAGVDAVLSRLAASPVELVVNNAGFGTSGPLATLPPSRLVDEISVNVVAVTRISRAVLPPMLAAGRGWILNVSSVASFQPAPRLAVYAATKAYVTSFTESLHEELRGTGVVATALCPGLTRTEFQSVSNLSGKVRRYPSVAWLTADRVAAVGLADTARGRALSVPGAPYKAMSVVSGVTPRFLKRRASGLARPGP